MRVAIVMAYFLLFAFFSTQCIAGDTTFTDEDFNRAMDSNIDKLTYDDALIKLGTPTSLTQGDDIFIASWSWTSRNSPNPNDTMGLSSEQVMMLYAMSSTRVEKLQLIFGKSSRKLRQWNYQSQ